MFKLPVCPHCNTIYRYGDVKKEVKKKPHTCYHCNKNFKISNLHCLVLTGIFIVTAVVTDIIEINIFSSINMIALMITNIVLIIIFRLLIPFFISFKKPEKINKKKKK